MTDSKGNCEAPALSIQDRRKQILRQVADRKKAISSSLSVAAVEDIASVTQKSMESRPLKRSLSPSPVSGRRSHSKSPKRPRSTSPIENSPVKKRKRPTQKLVSVSMKTQEVSAFFFSSLSLDLTYNIHPYYDLISYTFVYMCVCVFQDIPPPVKLMKLEQDAKLTEVKEKKKKKKKKGESGPLKESHLQLDDLPPELLPTHQERIKKKVCLCMRVCV